MFRIVIQMTLIALIGLAAGLIVNQLNPEGIHWRMLLYGLQSDPAEDSGFFIEAEEAFLLHLNKEVMFIDVRPRDEFRIDHIPEALSIPAMRLIRNPQIMDSLSSRNNYILYAFHPGDRFTVWAFRMLQSRQFNRVRILKDGFKKWLEMGFPVSVGSVSEFDTHGEASLPEEEL